MLAPLVSSPSSLDLETVAAGFVRLAVQAGAAIQAVRARSLTASAKSDGSPVTEADTAAEAIILAGLPQLCPGIPIIAEEAVSAGNLPGNVGPEFLLVDPLDGTKEFIAGRPEYTVNIALVRRGVPIAGVVYAPASGDMYVAAGPGAARRGLVGADSAGAVVLTPMHVRKPGEMLTAVASRSHSDAATEEFLAKLAIGSRKSIGSSLKFCLIAAGEADVYPRFGPTMEWDTAAGHAVLLAAGGSVTRPDGTPFLYGKVAEGYRNGGFIAWGREG